MPDPYLQAVEHERDIRNAVEDLDRAIQAAAKAGLRVELTTRDVQFATYVTDRCWGVTAVVYACLTSQEVGRT